MSLTRGSGPFAEQPGGTLAGRLRDTGEREAREAEGVLWFEDSPRRVRVELGGRTVAASDGMKLLHETGELPVYYFPREDVDADLLEAVGEGETSPLKGPTRLWTVRVEGREAEKAAYSHPEPPEGSPDLSGYVAFDFDAMDAWFEEDEEISVHPRDPYHRVDVRPSRRRVRVEVRGEPVAHSDRPLALFETSLPVRWYVPLHEVMRNLVVESDTVTRCPYKGRATHYHVRTEDGVVEDAAWCYHDPLPAVRAIEDHVAFYDGKADVQVEAPAD